MVEATPPLTVSSILRALPKGGYRSSFSPSPYGLAVSLVVSSRPSISCYFIVLRLNSGSHRLYRFHVTYARVSSTCKETHIRVRSSRGDTRTIHTPIHVHTHTDVSARSWGERCVCRYTEYLALSIQRKGITYYRRLPARRALIYCYPVRISCGKKRMPASPSSNSLPGFHPLPFVDRCFTSGRLSSALITFPSGARGSPLLPPL